MNLRYRPFDEFSQRIDTASDEEVAAYLEGGFKAGNYTQVRVGVGELWRRLRAARPAAPAADEGIRGQVLDLWHRIDKVNELARKARHEAESVVYQTTEMMIEADALLDAVRGESAPAATPDPAPVEKGDDVMGELVEAARAVLSNLGANGVALTRLKAAIAKAEGGGE